MSTTTKEATMATARTFYVTGKQIIFEGDHTEYEGTIWVEANSNLDILSYDIRVKVEKLFGQFNNVSRVGFRGKTIECHIIPPFTNHEIEHLGEEIRELLWGSSTHR